MTLRLSTPKQQSGTHWADQPGPRLARIGSRWLWAALLSATGIAGAPSAAAGEAFPWADQFHSSDRLAEWPQLELHGPAGASGYHAESAESGPARLDFANLRAVVPDSRDSASVMSQGHSITRALLGGAAAGAHYLSAQEPVLGQTQLLDDQGRLDVRPLILDSRQPEAGRAQSSAQAPAPSSAQAAGVLSAGVVLRELVNLRGPRDPSRQYRRRSAAGPGAASDMPLPLENTLKRYLLTLVDGYVDNAGTTSFSLLGFGQFQIFADRSSGDFVLKDQLSGIKISRTTRETKAARAARDGAGRGSPDNLAENLKHAVYAVDVDNVSDLDAEQAGVVAYTWHFIVKVVKSAPLTILGIGAAAIVLTIFVTGYTSRRLQATADPLSTDPLSTDPLSTDPLGTDPLGTFADVDETKLHDTGAEGTANAGPRRRRGHHPGEPRGLRAALAGLMHGIRDSIGLGEAIDDGLNRPGKEHQRGRRRSRRRRAPLAKVRPVSRSP